MDFLCVCVCLILMKFYLYAHKFIFNNIKTSEIYLNRECVVFVPTKLTRSQSKRIKLIYAIMILCSFDSLAAQRRKLLIKSINFFEAATGRQFLVTNNALS